MEASKPARAQAAAAKARQAAAAEEDDDDDDDDEEEDVRMQLVPSWQCSRYRNAEHPAMVADS